MADCRILIEAENRTVAVEGSRIVAAEGRFDCVLRFPGCEVRPGLINAHDHLHRNHYGRLGTPPYADAYAWAHDIQRHCRAEIAAGRTLPRREALMRGAWKNLFAGVTTVVHHDRWEADFDDGFPLRVVPIPSADSLGMTPDIAEVGLGGSFAIHLAEGIGARSAREVWDLAARALLGPRCVAVHGVGIAGEGIALFRTSGAALVWCPSSNLFLFGRTAPAELLREGVDVLLGSDSLLTGVGNLLDELQVARRTGLLTDRRLEDAVGATAARRLGVLPPTLQVGEKADLAVLSLPLLEANAENVELVMAGGVPRVAAVGVAATFEAHGWTGRTMTVAGVTRWTNGTARREWMNLRAARRPLRRYGQQRKSAIEGAIGA